MVCCFRTLYWLISTEFVTFHQETLLVG